MKRLKELLSSVLEISEDEITGETSPDNVQSWDSFNGLVLVSEMETKFKVKFTMNEIIGVKCVNDIKECLEKHGVRLEDDGK